MKQNIPTPIVVAVIVVVVIIVGLVYWFISKPKGNSDPMSTIGGEVHMPPAGWSPASGTSAAGGDVVQSNTPVNNVNQ